MEGKRGKEREGEGGEGWRGRGRKREEEGSEEVRRRGEEQHYREGILTSTVVAPNSQPSGQSGVKDQ